MKKIYFDVTVGYQREDEQTGVIVTIKREKTFEGADSYQQALDYYEKYKQAAIRIRRYRMDEAGLNDRDVFEGKEYKGEYCEFYTPNGGLFEVKMRIRVTDF